MSLVADVLRQEALVQIGKFQAIQAALLEVETMGATQTTNGTLFRTVLGAETTARGILASQ